MRVGVINSGDSDGVVTRTAMLRFGDSDVRMRAEKYTVVKAHSLEEIEFNIDTRATTSGHLDRLRALIRANAQDQFSLEITTSDSALLVDGRFPE
jgi:hypothetical protein